jgi:hypothetical protein
LWGDVSAAKAILDGHPKLATDGAQRLAALEARLSVKAQAALEFPLSAENSVQFLRMVLDHQLATQRLELAQQKFQHACRLADEKQRIADQRQVVANLRRGLVTDASAVESERRDLRSAEAEVAKRRAAASPLAQLRWRTASELGDSPRVASKPAKTRFLRYGGTRQERLGRRRQSANSRPLAAVA